MLPRGKMCARRTAGGCGAWFCSLQGCAGVTGLRPASLLFLQPYRLGGLDRSACNGGLRGFAPVPLVLQNLWFLHFILAVPARGAARPPFLSRGERKRRRRCKERRSRGPSEWPP